MVERELVGCSILVVEDEFILAEDLRQELTDAGAVVVGPAPSVGKAYDLIDSRFTLHAAILDVNLRGEQVYPVADILAQRHVPFVFTTGYDDSIIPARFSGTACFGKPVDFNQLMKALQFITASSGRHP